MASISRGRMVKGQLPAVQVKTVVVGGGCAQVFCLGAVGLVTQNREPGVLEMNSDLIGTAAFRPRAD